MDDLSKVKYNSKSIMADIKKEFEEVDADLLFFLNDSFKSNCKDDTLSSLKFGYSLNKMELKSFSNKEQLPEYLFLKVKIYLLEEVLSYLLLFSDITRKNFTKKITESTASILLNFINVNPKEYKSFNNALENNDLKEANKELMKKLAY